MDITFVGIVWGVALILVGVILAIYLKGRRDHKRRELQLEMSRRFKQVMEGDYQARSQVKGGYVGYPHLRPSTIDDATGTSATNGSDLGDS